RPGLDLARLDHQRRREIHQTPHDERTFIQLQVLPRLVCLVGENAEVEVTRGFVANEDCSVACIERVSNSLGKVSIKLIDTGYVLCARSEVEEDFAFVVGRGLVTAFNSGQEPTARKHMNSDENPNENE